MRNKFWPVSPRASIAQDPPVWTRVFFESESLSSSTGRIGHFDPKGSGSLPSSEAVHA